MRINNLLIASYFIPLKLHLTNYVSTAHFPFENRPNTSDNCLQIYTFWGQECRQFVYISVHISGQAGIQSIFSVSPKYHIFGKYILIQYACSKKKTENVS